MNTAQPYVNLPMCKRHPRSDTKSLQAILFPDPMPPQTPNTRIGDGSLLPPDIFSTAADERNDDVAVDRLQADTTERTAKTRI